jgi:hypothetical protein
LLTLYLISLAFWPRDNRFPSLQRKVFKMNLVVIYFIGKILNLCFQDVLLINTHYDSIIFDPLEQSAQTPNRPPIKFHQPVSKPQVHCIDYLSNILRNPPRSKPSKCRIHFFYHFHRSLCNCLHP